MTNPLLLASIGTSLTVFLLATGTACRAQAPAAPVIVRMDQPFLFTYGTWDKKAHIDDGVASLDADGMTPQGGGGVNQTLDLTADADDSPALRVQIGPKNTLKVLRLMLNDTSGNSATWRFPLPASPTTGYVVLTPEDGTPFSHPNSIEKGNALALGKIMQWQLLGDWGGAGPTDVRVNAILAVAPDAALTKQREALVQRDADARAQALRDRQAARERYAKVTASSPVIQAVYAGAPDVLGDPDAQREDHPLAPERLRASAGRRGEDSRQRDVPDARRPGDSGI